MLRGHMALPLVLRNEGTLASIVGETADEHPAGLSTTLLTAGLGRGPSCRGRSCFGGRFARSLLADAACVPAR